MSSHTDGQWITVNGRHILIQAGDNRADAIARAFEKKNSDLDKNKSVSEQLNKEKAQKVDTGVLKTHEKAVAELSKSKYEDGTYDIKTLKPVEYDSGYQVTFCQIGDDYSPEDYSKKVNECLKISSDGRTCAGKFEGTPEISFHCADKETAIAYARANNQISIWDWGSFEEIKTGGTGRRKR